MELIVLFVGAAPFLIGYYAIRLIRNNGDEGSDDQPPPPDPDPPLPILPPSPRTRRSRTSYRPPRNRRGPLARRRAPVPSHHTPA